MQSRHSAKDKILNINKKDIEQYLSGVKEAVVNGRYRLDRNTKRLEVISFHEQKYPLTYYFK